MADESNESKTIEAKVVAWAKSASGVNEIEQQSQQQEDAYIKQMVAKASASMREDLSGGKASTDHVIEDGGQLFTQAEKQQAIGAIPPTTLGGDEAIKAFHKKINNGEEPVKAFDEALSAYDKKIYAGIKLQEEKAGSKLGSAATDITGHETIKPLETPPTSKTRAATPSR